MAIPAPHLSLPVQWDMMEAHLDEAGFLWGQWERALVSPQYVMDEVADLEGRLLAHLDALVLGGRRVAGVLLEPALSSEDSSFVAPAAFALLAQEEKPEAGEEAVFVGLQEGDEAQRASICRALQLSRGKRVEARLRSLLDSAPPPQQAAILNVLGFWRVDPGPVLDRLLTHGTPDVGAAAFRAVRGLPRRLANEVLEAGLRSPEPLLREAALEAGLVHGSRRAWDECRRRVEMRAPGNLLSMQALALGGGAARQRLLFEALSSPEVQRDALRALGLIGTVDAAHACLSLMHNAALARLAGEAFSIITGLDLVGRNSSAFLKKEESELEGPEPEESELEGSESELPMPDVARVAAWWKREEHRFEPRRRHLQGQPFGSDPLLEALQKGSMYRRRWLAQELTLRTRGELILMIDTLTREQQTQLEEVRRAPASLLTRSPGEFHG